MISQIIATAIFLIMFVLIISEKFPRQWVTLACGAITLVVVFGLCMRDAGAAIEVLNVKSIFTLEFWYAKGAVEESCGINWATIIFIAGMMIMVEGMALAGFFRWLCMAIAEKVKFQIVPVFISFMLISAVLAMFIDSITVILFLASVTIELSKILKFDPVPMIISEIFCANLGGAATMCGDPPNIIIGTVFGYSFMDFLLNTGVIVAVALVFTIIYFYLCFRKKLAHPEGVTVNPADYPHPADMITDKKHFIISTIIFFIAVVLLVTHAQTGLTVSFIGVLIGVLTLAAAGKQTGELLKKIDYHTLMFFIGLFIVVGGLEKTGVLETVAEFIGHMSGGSLMLLLAIIIWISGVASAIVDNIPFAAAMVPVVKALSVNNGFDLSVLSWALAIGTDIGGSATPIGGSANVVGTSIAAKDGHPISWGQYCKYMIPASVIVLTIGMVIIWARYL